MRGLTLYLFTLLVRFQKLAELPSSWHTHASHMSISTANQFRLWIFEITDSLFVSFSQAATSISLLISQIPCIVSSIKTRINQWGICPSLKAQSCERDIAFTVCPNHAAVYCLPISLSHLCVPVTIAAACLWAVGDFNGWPVNCSD